VGEEFAMGKRVGEQDFLIAKIASGGKRGGDAVQSGGRKGVIPNFSLRSGGAVAWGSVHGTGNVFRDSLNQIL